MRAAAAEAGALIWLSSVNRAEFPRLIVREFHSQPARSGRWVLQVGLVGGTAF